MAIKRDLTEQEEEAIYRAVDEFREHGRMDITCPICNGKLEYVGNYSSYSILCQNCGNILSLRGI